MKYKFLLKTMHKEAWGSLTRSENIVKGGIAPQKILYKIEIF